MELDEMRREYLRVTHRMGHIKMMSAPMVFVGITRLEFFALTVLSEYRKHAPESKGMYVSSLACSLTASPPAVSRMLRSMERKGLVSRSVDREDRRNTFIQLTEEGERIRRDVIRHMEERFQRIYEKMGAEDLETLLTLWNRFADIMEQEVLLFQEGEREC